MSHLTKLTLRGWQKHKLKEIPLDEHVTVLVGDNYSGKSSALRGLRWVCLNETPRTRKPLDYINHNSTKAKVILELSDGTTVARVRSSNLNVYKLDGSVYKVPGRSVPVPIAKRLSLGEDNFQSQISLPFWFSETPGTVSRNLNKIVNLSLIDSSLESAAQELRRSKARKEVSRERLEEARRARSDLAWIEECNSDFGRVESIQDQMVSVQTDLEALELTLEDIKALERKALVEIPSLFDLKKAKSVLDNCTDTLNNLHQSLEEIHDLEEKCQRLETISIANQKELAKIKTCPTCGTPIRQT